MAWRGIGSKTQYSAAITKIEMTRCSAKVKPSRAERQAGNMSTIYGSQILQ